MIFSMLFGCQMPEAKVPRVPNAVVEKSDRDSQAPLGQS